MRKCVAGAIVSCWIIAGSACRNTSASGNVIIPRDTMQVLLWEMFEADAYNETRAATDTNFRHDTAFAALYTDIFRTHHVTRAQFTDSYDYYMTHPEVLRKMIDTLTDKAGRDMSKAGGPPSTNHPPPAPFRGYTPTGHPGGPMGQPPLGPNGRLPPGFRPPVRPAIPPPGQRGVPPPRPGLPPPQKP